jgi:hypothetical protein
MRTKLLSALLLASTALTGVASASPIVRDHRYQQPQVTVTQQRYDRDHDRDRNQWSAGVQVTSRPTWMPQVNYGFQVTAGNSVVPYPYGQDPYVEGIARGEWMTLNPCIDFAGHNAAREAMGGRPLQSVEFQATTGGAYIYTVGVIFRDGHQRAFQINRTLDASHEPNLRIDLGAEGLNGVNAIVLDGTGSASVRMLGA